MENVSASSMMNFVALAIALGALVLVWLQARRIDRLSRRQSYETESLVKNLQTLEQQHLLQQQRLNGVIGVSQKVVEQLRRIPVPAPRAAADSEEAPPLPRPVNRQLH